MAPTDKFLPAQAPIDAVLDNGFRFGEMSHQGGLIGLPGRTQAWNPRSTAFEITAEDLAPVLEMADVIDILLIGTGSDIAVLPQSTLDALREVDLAVEISATRAAVRTYNVLLSENRRVAAALMALT